MTRIEFCLNLAKYHWRSTQIIHIFHISTLNVYIYIYSKKSLADTNWFLLISYFWQRKNIAKKFGKHHRDNCCLLFAKRNCSTVPYGVFWRSQRGGNHGTKLKIFQTKKTYKTFIDFYKTWNEQFWSINLQLNKISATFAGYMPVWKNPFHGSLTSPTCIANWAPRFPCFGLFTTTALNRM